MVCVCVWSQHTDCQASGTVTGSLDVFFFIALRLLGFKKMYNQYYSISVIYMRYRKEVGGIKIVGIDWLVNHIIQLSTITF